MGVAWTCNRKAAYDIIVRDGLVREDDTQLHGVTLSRPI